MSADFPTCRIEDSGWQPGSSTGPDLYTAGDHLRVEFRRWQAGETLAVEGTSSLAEELAAVIEGRFELVCGDERYELGPGDGILIPPREGRVWRLLSNQGALYRVLGPDVA